VLVDGFVWLESGNTRLAQLPAGGLLVSTSSCTTAPSIGSVSHLSELRPLVPALQTAHRRWHKLG
jgi:hypothetical protein